MQVVQKVRCIGRVGGRVERLIQAGERIGMVHQVDLHAADVDRLDAARLQCVDRGDRLGLGVVVAALPLGVLVSEHVPQEDALWGLLHDASEAYLCDLPAPIKRDPEMSIYRIAEDRLMLAVCQKFGLRPEMPKSVMLADKLVLATEFRDVTTVDDLDWIIAECGVAPLEHILIHPWPPCVAEERFLHRFWDLTR